MISSSQGKNYTDPDYDSNKPLIPHGLSVVTTAPADFIFTTPAYPQRHLEAANLLGADLPVCQILNKIKKKYSF